MYSTGIYFSHLTLPANFTIFMFYKLAYTVGSEKNGLFKLISILNTSVPFTYAHCISKMFGKCNLSEI